MISKERKNLMIFQKKVLGLLGFFLAPSAILFGLWGDNSAIVDPKWWYSISMTYYATSNICMIGVLFTMSILFFSYVCYDKSDRWLTLAAGLCAMGIIAFPCGHSGIETTGILGIKCCYSFVIHCICASLMFISFAILVGYNFRLSEKGGVVTREKMIRNKIYSICSCVIIVFMVNQLITSILHCPGYWTLINEAVMLWAFSFSWLVKAEFFPCFNDKEVA
ncbi:MAG: hypothetical protein IKQ46_13950 [Bacteroidales bacterium]|nr:hypothetical protein [Bacteroidales bacterium]